MGILRVDRVSGLGGANAIDGSAHFQGDHDGTAYVRYIDAGISDDFNFGTGDFTVECWLNREALSNDDTIWATTAAEGSSSLFWYFNSSGNLRAYLGEGTSERTSSSNNIIRDRWYHVALTRESGTVNMWVDGVSKYSASSVTVNVGSSTQNFIIGDGNTGYNGNAYMFLGHISNLRIQKGKAEYTAAFTPPTTRLNVTPETVLLACHDPGNVLAEATGKTLTLVKSGTSGSNSAGIVASRFTPNRPIIGTTSGFSTTTDVGTQFGLTFDGVTTFDSQAYMVPSGGNTAERNRGRGLHAGGENPSHCNIIDFIQIQSGGISEDFGDLLTVSNSCDGVSSKTRAVFATYDAPTYNSLEFVTMATTGNATDFGDQTISTGQEGSLSNATRGLFAGGYGGAAQVFINTVEFITIPTLGNAQDFGNLREAMVGVGGASDTTRGLFVGGFTPGAYRANIDQFTIATTGDATDFGDLSVARRNPAGTSDSTRGVFFGGNDSGGTNVIDFVTIQSAGNATDFGDSTSNQSNASGASDSIRGVFSAGYYGSPHLSNVIEKVIIQTTGNSVDYGDLIDERIQGGSVSDSHGGLE